MKKMMWLTAVLVWGTSLMAQAAEPESGTHMMVQGLIGGVKFDDLKFDDVQGLGDPLEVDVSDIFQAGGVWATKPKGSWLQYGFECSLFVGASFDDVSGYAGGGGTEIHIESQMWMFDLAVGPYLNLNLGEKVRAYVSGGPLLMYADYSSEREEEIAGQIAEFENDHSTFGTGAYVRGGVEVQVHEGGYVGLSARTSWADMDFSDIGGETDVKGSGAYLTYTLIMD